MNGQNILMFVPSYPYPVIGGLERQAHEISKNLMSKGISVWALSGIFHNSQSIEQQVEGVLVRRVPWPKSKILRAFITPLNLIYVCFKQRKEIDIIHLHQHSWVGLILILFAHAINKPVLTKLPGVDEYGLPGLKKSFLGLIKLAILKTSDGIIAMSPKSYDELIEISYPASQILKVPNGIASTNKAFDKSHDIRSLDPIRVVFVGRLSSEKQVDILLAAWARILSKVGCIARLELWGDGPQRPDLENQCKLLGIDESVIFRGYVDNVRDALRSADIFVLPSRTEGNSNAILEAMDAGLPVVATKVGGTPLLVGKDGDLLLFDVGDVSKLESILINLIERPELVVSYGSLMRKRIEQYFDLEKITPKLIDAYRLLSNGQKDKLYQCGNYPL